MRDKHFGRMVRSAAISSTRVDSKTFDDSSHLSQEFTSLSHSISSRQGDFNEFFIFLSIFLFTLDHRSLYETISSLIDTATVLELVVIVVVVLVVVDVDAVIVVVVAVAVVVVVVFVVVVVVLSASKFDSNRRLAFALSLPRESVAKFHIYTIKLDAFLYAFFFFFASCRRIVLTFCPEERHYLFRLPI